MGIFDRLLSRAGYTRKTQQLDRPIPAHLLAEAYAERWTMPDYSSYQNQAELYSRLSWINTAIGILARTAAAVPFNVSTYSDETAGDIVSHPFEDLLQRPNPLHSRFELLEHTFSYLRLCGNSYWWLNIVDGSIKEIWPIRPQHIMPVPDENMYLRGYAFKPENYAVPTPLGIEEVVHFKAFNPYSDFVGLSFIESLALAAESDLSMQKQNVRIYSEGAGRLPSILAFANSFTPGDWKKMQQQIRSQETKRQMMLLQNTGSGDVKWIQNSVTAKEMEYLQSRNFTKEEIFDNIAPGLASMLAVNATEANSVAGKASFLEFAVYPIQRAIGEKITNDILPFYGENLRGEFEDVRMKDKVFNLQEQQEYARTHTIDEIRQKYYSDDPIGDERGSLLPVQVTAPMGGQLIPAQEGSFQPLLEKPKEIQNEEQEVVDEQGSEEETEEQSKRYESELKAWERKALSKIKSGKIANFESNILPELIQRRIKSTLADCKTADDVREVFACKAITRQRDKKEPRREQKETLEEKIVKIISTRWKRQAAIVQQRLEQRYPMRQKSEVNIDLDFIDHDEEIEKLEMALTRLLVFAATDGVDLFSEFIPLQIDYTLTNAEAANWATQYAGKLVKNIDETTLDVLRKAVSSFVETPGMTIRDVMDLLPYNERRARLIAVTEITNSYAAGEQMAGAALAEQFPDVPVYKTWWTNNDDRTCDLCGPLHGVSVPQDQEFAPGVDAPARHVGCRCWTSYSTRIKS